MRRESDGVAARRRDGDRHAGSHLTGEGETGGEAEPSKLDKLRLTRYLGECSACPQVRNDLFVTRLPVARIPSAVDRAGPGHGG